MFRLQSRAVTDAGDKAYEAWVAAMQELAFSLAFTNILSWGKCRTVYANDLQSV